MDKKNMDMKSIDEMKLDSANERPVELNEGELKEVSGGAGSEGRMVCMRCGATTSNPDEMKRWRLNTVDRYGVTTTLCEKCKRYSLTVERPSHAE